MKAALIGFSVFYWIIALMWIAMVGLGDCGAVEPPGRQQCIDAINQTQIVSAAVALALYGLIVWYVRRR